MVCTDEEIFSVRIIRYVAERNHYEKKKNITNIGSFTQRFCVNGDVFAACRICTDAFGKYGGTAVGNTDKGNDRFKGRICKTL